MKKKVVIGLGYGDEGKGHVVNWLSNGTHNGAVVRYCGGHQVGHNVVAGKMQHVFSNFGSGTLNGTPTIWNANTCDPVGIVGEYYALKDKHDITPVLHVNPMTPVTTPWDKAWNIKREENVKHSTMAVGFGATIQREEDNLHLYFHDLSYEVVRDAKLSAIEKYYINKGVDVSDSELNKFLAACKEVLEIVIEREFICADTHIYESSQGMMLDMDYGFFPYVTRSQLGTQNIDVDKETEFYLVTRAYQTRHGNGPVGDEPFSPIETAHKEHNIYSDNQGAFKTRVLDLDLLDYALTIDEKISKHPAGKKNLVITCLDHLSSYKLIMDGKVKEFESESLFLKAIAYNIPKMNNMYISHGPEEHNIVKYRP